MTSEFWFNLPAACSVFVHMALNLLHFSGFAFALWFSTGPKAADLAFSVYRLSIYRSVDVWSVFSSMAEKMKNSSQENG